MAFLTDDISINTILGSGSFITNQIKVQGNLRIEGDVDGNIESTGNVFIGEKARIKGNINADSIEIYGVVIGDLLAPKSVKVHSTSVVIGDICTKMVQIDTDAVFNGHCISHKNEENYEKAKNEYETEISVLKKSIRDSIN